MMSGAVVPSFLIGEYNDALVAIMLGRNMNEYVLRAQRGNEPGTCFSYRAIIDSLALNMVLRGVLGDTMSLGDFIRGKVTVPLGMQDEVVLQLDDFGLETGEILASARDMAKLGEAYRNMGRNHAGVALVDDEFVLNSTTVINDKLQRYTEKPCDPSRWGYGYQIWLPPGDDQDYEMFGSFDQIVYVNPRFETTIVKFSAKADSSSSYVNLFRKISENLSRASDAESE